MRTNVILDVSNLFYSAFHAHSKEQENILLAMANQTFMDIINKYHREFASDEIVLAFDGSKNWRKTYTKMPDAVTHKRYKGHRREKLTEAEKRKLEAFDAHVVEFRKMLKEYTGLLVLFHDRLEADDLIAGFIQSRPKEKHLIISRDKDYMQLLRFPTVSIMDPKTKKYMTLEEYDDNADFFMFQKCLRGDAGDNVQSAYPNIRATKIKAAFHDDYELANVIQHKFVVEYFHPVSGEKMEKHYKTGKLYAENKILMDLTEQPEPIRDLIDEAIKDAYKERGRYNMVQFLRFCGRMDFQHIIQNVTKYSKLLKGPGSSALMA